MTNKVTRSLSIRYPIIMGGMGGVSTAPLVAAVSNAGGLGLLGSALWDKEQLKEQIKKTRELSQDVFGVNIPVAARHSELLIEAAIEENIKVVATSAGNPARFTPILRQNGVFVIHVASTVEYAIKADQAGVNAVVAEGSESGGTTSLAEISTMALVPQVVRKVKCPVIAAGGIGNGNGLVAALALGASAVQMGTVFLAAQECEISDGFKQMMIQAREIDTQLVRTDRNARRIFDEAFYAGFLKQFPEKTENLNSDEGAPIRGMGQITGLISEILPAKEIIDGIMQEALSILPNLESQLKT